MRSVACVCCFCFVVALLLAARIASLVSFVVAFAAFVSFCLASLLDRKKAFVESTHPGRDYEELLLQEVKAALLSLSSSLLLQK